MEYNTTKICEVWGGEIHIDATRCKHCQAWITPEMKPRNFLDTLLLCWFLGAYGIHRFYTGYTVIGLVQLFTLGGCGIWSMIDFFCILFNNYKDVNGNALTKYNRSTAIIVLVIQLVAIVILIALIVAMALLGIAAAMSMPE